MSLNKAQLLYLVLLFFLFSGARTSLYAQTENPLADSIRLLLISAKEDTNKVNLLNDLGWELKFDNPKQARATLREAAQLATQLSYPRGEAQSYNNLGVVETIHEQFESAKENYEKALILREQLNDKKGVASLYNNIGNLETELGNHEAAIEQLRKSLRIREELKDSLRIARTSNNIALAFEARGFYPEALDYALTYLTYSEWLGDQYEIGTAHNLVGNIKTELERFTEASEHYDKSLAIRQQLGDPLELAMVYQNIGNNRDDTGERYYREKLYTLAEETFLLSLEDYAKAQDLYNKLEDQEGIGSIFNNIGLVYKNLGSNFLKQDRDEEASTTFELAMKNLNQSLAIRQESGDLRGLTEVYNGIGDVKRRQKDYKSALFYTQKYYDLAKKIEDDKFIQKAYKDLSRIYDKLGNYQKAFKYRKKYDELRYERLSEERVKQNTRREAIYGDLKKEFDLERERNTNERQEAELREAALQRTSLLFGLLGLIILAILLYNRYRIKNNANKELEDKNRIIQQERERSDELLLNILPEKTAMELKKNNKAAAQSYESVSVLFTDFKDFTQITEKMSPDDLVTLLDECFRAFDDICSKNNIEKIKTIGDSYMCAGGLPEVNETHATDCVRAALEIRTFMDNFNAKSKQKGQPIFETRIGVHTGPVIAGIVGSKKFAYDIWGDTVNTAARMESSGEAGKVNISQSTFELVKDRFRCQSRGKIDAKNKGEIEMYFVDYSYNELHSSKKVYS